MNTTNVSTPRRGLKKSEVVNLLKDFKFPAEPFTLKQLVNAFGVDHWLVVDWAKKNGKVVGTAAKDAGTNGKSRGPAAKLYQLPADKLSFKL